MTIMESLQWANRKLKKHRDVEPETGAKLDAPMLDAQVLLASALGVQKGWLFMHFNDPLRDHELERFEAMVERRARHEPIAYITGTREFYKRDFQVNPFTLIPRPDTEALVSEALRLAKADDADHTLFADVGTGSGAIAITLAAESKIPVVATDLNRRALTVAQQNAAALGVADLVDFRHGDLLEPLVKIFEKLKTEGDSPIAHLILCANLPYLTTRQWETAQPEVRDFEPKEALEAGTDGLDAYWRLLRELLRHRALFPTRLTILLEIDPAQRDRIQTMIQHDFPSAEPRILPDLSGLARVAVAEL